MGGTGGRQSIGACGNIDLLKRIALRLSAGGEDAQRWLNHAAAGDGARREVRWLPELAYLERRGYLMHAKKADRSDGRGVERERKRGWGSASVARLPERLYLRERGGRNWLKEGVSGSNWRCHVDSIRSNGGGSGGSGGGGGGE